MANLDGRVAIVTGGAQGIGRAAVRRLLAAGATVAVWDLQEPADRAALLGPDPPVDAALHTAAVDVRKPETIQVALDALLAATGRVDVLINNAGVTVGHKPTVELSPEVWQALIATNLTGAFHCVRAVVPHMSAQRWGRIINVTSVVAEYGYPGHAAYVASKAGLAGVTRGWAREFGRVGITVNAVRPGYVRTPMNDRDAAQIEPQVIAMTPLGRLGEPEDVAGAMAWLCSDDASFVTGAVIAVDGGLIT